MRTTTMQLASQSGEPDDNVSPSIYAALIDSLFQNPVPLFAGALLAALAAGMTAFKTQLPALWFCVAALTVIGMFRAIDMHWYMKRKSALTAAEAANWEIRYQVGALLYTLALGVWCTVALFMSDDADVHMICLTVTTGYVSAGVGRTYGRPWVYHLQVALACGPSSIALALHGTPYYIGLAIVFAVFCAALRGISTNLQRIFVQALIAREREAALAGQFDTALHNMPHGLSMFRADGRLAVMNRRFGELMQLSENFAMRGASAADIVSACVAAGSISAESGNLLLVEIEHAQMKEIVTTDPDLERGRTLAWTFQPMAGGGTVLLLEDVTERTNAEAKISHLARYDELPALPNRVSFRDEIERLLAISHSSERLCALLFVDLDQFKQVND